MGHTVLRDEKGKIIVLSATSYSNGMTSLRPLGLKDSVEYLGLQFTWKDHQTPNYSSSLGDH